MRSKDDLFHLIKAMSKSEKRYFVLDAKKAGGEASRYHALFDALNDLEKYDEKADAWLKKKFPKNLSADKAYLYESILRSMRDYRSPSSKAAQVKERLMDARYLYERGLYDQSTGRITEAKEMAKELEDQFALLEINKEEQVSLFDRKASVQLEHIEMLNEERQRTLEAIGEELEYLKLYYLLTLEVRREFNLKDADSIKALNERLSVDLLSAENKPGSPQALRRYYLCKANYFNLLGELDKVYYYFLEVVKWWEAFPAFKEEEFHRYIVDISNLVNTCYKLPEYHDTAQEWLDKLRQEKSSKSFHNERVIFQKISISNLLHLLNQNKFQNARNLLPEIEEGLKKFVVKNLMVIEGNMATVCFLVRDYQECIRLIEQSFKNNKTGGREDIQRILRLYKLISLNELGQDELVEANIRSTQRYFNAVKLPKDAFENIVLNEHLKRIFNSPSTEIKNGLIDFNQYLEEVRDNPKTGNTLGVDEFIIWAKEKQKLQQGRRG